MNTTPATPPSTEPPEPFGGLRRALLDRFDLTADQADHDVIDASIRSGVPFRGTNLWLLIFAIVVASVGLNVNSTAVIIGAMLISPLMGPILGVGYGAAVADFPLVRLATVNLLIATGVSLGASTLYFLATPLSEAHSELLARTSPTIWDVLIALFGGLAGIVGSTRKQKSNVIPGVAIATALMPPLCTAGFGLATGNLTFFAGAFYLFFINSVFIGAATFVVVRLLRLPEITHSTEAASRRAHRWIALVVGATALPSLFLAERLVAAELFNSNAASFLQAAFPAEGATIVVGRDLDPEAKRIRVTLLGEQVTPERREALSALLPAYNLEGATLSLAQATQNTVDVAALREGLVRDLYQKSVEDVKARDETIRLLTEDLERASASTGVMLAIEKEISAQHPEASRVVVARAPTGDGALTVVLEGAKALDAQTAERLRAWLRVRAGVADVWVLQAKRPEPEAAAR